MTAAWMVWTVAVSALLAVAARALEEVAHLLRLPLRWVWAVALAGSAAAPVLAHLALSGGRGASTAIGVEVAMVPTGVPDAPAVVTSAFPWTAALAGLDGPLLAGWAAASVAVLLLLVAGAGAFALRRRGWRETEVDGHRVLLTPDVGPAVAGLVRSRIVLPVWALEVAPDLRRLMLEHEAEHVRAGDPRLLGAGLLVAALLPWNPVVWWQLRRLRLAIEVDCDRRVLRRRPDPRAYGALLLEMGAHGRRRPLLAAAAFSEPRTTLEARILRMTQPTPRARWLRTTLFTLVGAGAALAAAAAPAPDRPLELAAAPAQEAASAPAAPVVERLTETLTVPVDTPPAMSRFTEAPRLLNPDGVRELLRTEYPPLLKDAGIGGSAEVWIFVSTEGAVADAKIKESSGYEGLDEAALRVAREMRFAAARNGDQPVATWVSLNIAFASERATRVEDAQGVDLTPPPTVEKPLPPQVSAERPPVGVSSGAPIPPASRAGGAVQAAPQYVPFDTPPRLLNRGEVQRLLQAEYPPLLRDAGISGAAGVWFFIDETGAIRKTQLQDSSGYDSMDVAALTVARQMRFAPAEQRGEPVAIWTTLKIEFKAN